MDKNLIDLAANQKTKPCSACLERQTDESILPYRTERIYDLAGARSSDIFVFTSSGAEAITQILWSVFLNISRKTGKCHFITSNIEDAPTLQMMKRLEELGCFVKIAPVNEKGEIDVEKLKELITPRTALISISMAQGLTGVIQPVEEIATIAQEKGVLLHLDATNSFGKYHFRFDELNADYLSFSGDRIHSLIGTGGLFAKKEAPLSSLIAGGNALRGGALDTESILSLCSAASQASLFLDAMSLEVARLRDLFEKEILKLIPEAQILFKKSLRLPNTTVIAFPYAHQEALHYRLQRKNILTLIGGNYSQHLFHLLLASQIDPNIAACAISFSFSRMTTEEEIRKSVLQIEESVRFLQKISQIKMDPADTMTYNGSTPFSKKLREKIDRPKFSGSFSEEEAKQKGMRLVKGDAKGISFFFLVDETDGIIADAKFVAFGPIALIGAGEVGCELVIRKNHQQASRISSDLIDQHVRDKKDIPAFPLQAGALLNQTLSAIDAAMLSCADIPCKAEDFDTTPIEWDPGEHPNGIPGWDTFSITKKIQLIEEVIDKEIRPYVELDAGGVTINQLTENNELLISYHGSCTTCHSSTGSTLTAIQQILRTRIHPKLTVIPLL
jgi:cysteine desulfurase